MATKYGVRIPSAPHPGSIYWCDLYPENIIHLPEFFKKRPVIVVSKRGDLHGKVIVLPMTTDISNANNKNAIEVSAEIRAQVDNQRTWVICDFPMTVATSRLDMVSKVPPKITGADFAAILTKVHGAMVTPQVPPAPPPTPATTVTVGETITTTTIETNTETIVGTTDTVTVLVQSTPVKNT